MWANHDVKYDLENLVKDFGGIDEAEEALRWFRAEAERRGPQVCIRSVHCAGGNRTFPPWTVRPV